MNNKIFTTLTALMLLTGTTMMAATSTPNFEAARLVKQVQPLYPQTARQTRIQGTVKFSAVIGKDGKAQSIQPISGHPMLVPAAMEAVKQWIYTPTMLDGAPVSVQTQIEVTFALRH